MVARAWHLLAALICCAASAAAQDSASHVRRIDSLFAEYGRAGSPGLAVAVVRDGQVLLERGYGYANLEHAMPIGPTTVFDVASVSKQFAGLAIAMLAERGQIALDDDVRKYVPELPDFGYRITIRHLVHHTSGLRDWPGTLSVAGWRMDDVISFDQILRMAYGQRTLNFVPGSEYTYSNTGYNLLAEIVARATAVPFPAWTWDNLFRPLGMSATHFHDDHAMIVPERAYGYARTAGGYRAVTNNLTALGSSSLFSSVRDMAKWLANLDEGRVGGLAALDLMRTRGKLDNDSTISYAFGLVHSEHRGRPVLSHSGSWAAFRSFLVHFPQQRFGVVVLANTDAVNPVQAAYAVADVFLETTPATASGQSRATTLAGAPVAVARARGRERRAARANVKESEPPLDIAEFAGRYESEELNTFYDVQVTDSRLTLQHRRHGAIPLERLWGDNYRGGAWFLGSVEFERDSSGSVTGFVVNVDERSRNIRFVKRRNP